MQADAEGPPASRDEASTRPTLFGAFRKKTYTLGNFFTEARAVRSHRRLIRGLWTMDAIDPAFREAIMVAVARVNGCRYCSFAHHEWALHVGLPTDELAQIEGLDPAQFDPKKWLAIEYARALAAEDFGPVSPLLERKMRDAYTEEEREHIEVVARVMTFSNRSANTFDALLSRFKGVPAAGSRVLDELLISFFVLLVVPVVAARMAMWRKVSPLRILREFRKFSRDLEAAASV
jgi:AhpD family alkylhydroperoxidase